MKSHLHNPPQWTFLAVFLFFFFFSAKLLSFNFKMCLKCMCMWANFHEKTLPSFFAKNPSLCIAAVNYCMQKYIVGN